MVDPTQLVGWQLLNQILPGLPGDFATKLSSAKVDTTNKTATVPFGGGTLCGFTLENGVVGISFANPTSPSLFITGTVTTPISSGYPADVRGVFSSGKGGSVNALLSGTINRSFPTVPIVSLTLSDPTVVIGVNSRSPEIPTVGAGGEMTLSSLDLSGLMLFDSSDPKKSVLVASVSKLSLYTIATSFPGVNSVPVEMRPLLDSVSLSGPSGEDFSIDVNGGAYGGLADDLDAKQLDRVSAAFNAATPPVALPTDPDQVVLVVLSRGEKWAITNLHDDTHRHYQLTKSADGTNIQVTVDAQIYLAPSGATIAGNTFKQGMAVRGYVEIFGQGGNVDLEVDTDIHFSKSVSVDVGSVRIPGVSVPGFPSIPGFSINVGTLSVGLTITTGGAHMNFQAFGWSSPDISLAGDSPVTELQDKLRDKVIDAIKDHLTPHPEAYAAAALAFFQSIGEDIGSFFGGFSRHSDPPDPNNTTKQQIADEIANYKQGMVQNTLGLFPFLSVRGFVKQWAAWKFLPSQLVWPLKQNGYSAREIGDAIMAIYQVPVALVAQLLWDAGFPVSEVGQALALSCDGGWTVMAQILVGAGYDVKTVADCFNTHPFNMRLSAAETISFLGEAGQKVTTQWPDEGLCLIVPAAGLANPIKRLLGYDSDLGSVRFFDRDDGSGMQTWSFRKLGADGVYTISAGSSESLGLLSCRGDGNPSDAETLKVDLYDHDDNSGRQQWKLTPIGDGSFTITIEKPGALANPDYKYLSCSADGLVVDLYNRDDGSGRQHWRLLVPPPNAKVTDYAIWVGASTGSGSFLTAAADGSPVTLSRSATSSWVFEWGWNGIYNIRLTGPTGPGQYLSCRQDGDPSDEETLRVDLFSSDDNSGRQQWTLRTSNSDSFTATIEKQGALNSPDYKYLSCRGDGKVDLWKEDDGSGRQRWSVSWAPAASLGDVGWPEMAKALIGEGYDVHTVADCFRTYRFNMKLNAAETAFVMSAAGHPT